MKIGIITFLMFLFTAQMALAEPEVFIPQSIRFNRFLLQSRQYSNQARLAFIYGEYTQSIELSEKAIHYANLSDEYIRMRLAMRDTDRAIAAARDRLRHIQSTQAASRFPAEYSRARGALDEALALRAEGRWDEATSAANRVLSLLAYVDVDFGSMEFLPARYTVRHWHTYEDSLWNIAGRPWVFNNPFLWRRLYEANRHIMPQPGNPDLIHPGMILEIPSIRGEVRQGMWDAAAEYPFSLWEIVTPEDTE